MKKTIFVICVLFMAVQLFSYGSKEIPDWGTVESMNKSVEKQLGHELEKYEQTIIDTTYLYYYNKCEGEWTREIWDIAVDKAVVMCRNNIAIAAAKTGVFGEKLLQTLIVTAEDIVSGISNWIESGSEKYNERHN